jgi:hypothetical protein
VKIDKNTWTVEWVEWFISWIWGNWEWWYQEWANGQFTNYTPISKKQLVQWAKDFMNSFVKEDWSLWWIWGECWSFVNDYLQKLWFNRLYVDPIDKKKAITNTNEPYIWAVAVMDSKNYPQYWHVAIVVWIDKNNGNLTLLESNRWWDKSVHLRTNVNPSKIYWYFNPSISPSNVANQYWYWENPMTTQISNMISSKDLNAEQKKDLQFASQAYWIMYDLASSWWIDHLLRSSDWQKMLANLKNSKFIQDWDSATWSQVLEALRNWITDQKNIQTVNDLINVIELKLRKTSWAAIAASEWISNFDMLLPWLQENYNVAKNKYERFEKTYLMNYFNSAGSNIKWYKYEPLFSANSPYYKTENWVNVANKFNTQNNKGTWNLWGVNNTQLNNYDDLYSYMWI